MRKLLHPVAMRENIPKRVINALVWIREIFPERAGKDPENIFRDFFDGGKKFR
jgi:hypothetical protein